RRTGTRGSASPLSVPLLYHAHRPRPASSQVKGHIRAEVHDYACSWLRRVDLINEAGGGRDPQGEGDQPCLGSCLPRPTPTRGCVDYSRTVAAVGSTRRAKRWKVSAATLTQCTSGSARTMYTSCASYPTTRPRPPRRSWPAHRAESTRRPWYC